MAFNHALGIDFGTDTIKICDKKNRITVCEKNMIAIRDEKRIIAIGDSAYEMYEKTPANVKAGSPMAHGAIAEAQNAGIVLSHLLKKHKSILSGRPAIFIAVPRDLSAVEKRAYYTVLSGIVPENKIYLVDKGIADNLGVGVSMDSPRASMLVNMGAGTTEVSVVAGGKILMSKTLQTGGDQLDEDIITMCRRMYHIHIGKKTAVSLKTTLAYAGDGPANSMIVYGISTVSGHPVTAEVTSMAVSMCMERTIQSVAEELRGMIDRLPPQFHQDILEAGFCLIGGCAMIFNLSDYFRRQVRVPVSVVSEPGLATMRGIQVIMNQKDLVKNYTYSLRDLTASFI